MGRRRVLAPAGGATACCIGALVRVEENSGSAYQYLISAGGLDQINSAHLYLGEASVSLTGDRNNWVGRVRDAEGDSISLTGAAATGADGLRRLVVYQYDGTTMQVFLCAAGGAAVLDRQQATALVGGFTPSTNWRLGGRADGNVDRFFEEHVRRAFFGSRVLTTAEMEDIAAETRTPSGVLGGACLRSWLFPGAAAVVPDEVAGWPATRAGSGWPATVAW